MGICYSCCCVNKGQIVHTVVNPSEDLPQPSSEYEIILKVPHGIKCFQINDTSTAWEQNENINNSLKNLYKNITLDHWVVYNDETPEKTVGTGAHAKGILAWNNDTITWLIHSVPKFPLTFYGTSDFPDIHHSELEYGQSFIFIRFGIEHLENILTQLFIMHPTVYISNINYEKYKKLHKQKTSNIYKINDRIHHVSKSPDFHKDLYEDIVLPKFGGCCYTETWVRGHQCTDTNQCKMICKMNWNDTIVYSYTHDHSKFCYSENGWVMVGDINRMVTQFKRGGGGVILHDKNMVELFKKITQIQ
jgi:deoxyribonuclease-2